MGSVSVRVNQYVTERQYNPRVLPMDGGGYAVLWDSFIVDEGVRTRVQRYDAAGSPVDGETPMVGFVRSPDVPLVVSQALALGGGRFLLQWQVSGKPRFQVFDGMGAPLGAVQTPQDSMEQMARLSDGSFVTVGFGNADVRGAGLRIQRYDSLGNPVGEAFTPAPAAGEYLTLPPRRALAALPDGGYTLVTTDSPPIVYTGRSSWREKTVVVSRRYSAQGQLLEEPTLIGDFTDIALDARGAASDGQGGWIVAWHERLGSLSAPFRLWLRRFDASGKPKGEALEIAQAVYRSFEFVDLRPRGDGTVEVTWRDSGDALSTSPEMARTLGADGRWQGDARPRGDSGLFGTVSGELARLPDGVTVLVRTVLGSDGSASGIQMERFDSAGVPLAQAIALPAITATLKSSLTTLARVNTEIDGDQNLPTIRALPDGRYLVVWVHKNQALDGQWFSAAGERLGGAMRLFEAAPGTQTWATAQLTPLDGGTMLVSAAMLTYGRVVFRQREIRPGEAPQAEFPRYTAGYSFPYSPLVAALGDGTLMMVWQNWSNWDVEPNALDDVYMQRLDALGQPIGERQSVNLAHEGSQQPIGLRPLLDGGLSILWLDFNYDTRAGRIVQRRFAANGAPTSGEELVASYTYRGESGRPVLAALGQGSAVFWLTSLSSNGGELRAQRLDSRGNLLGAEATLASLSESRWLGVYPGFSGFDVMPMPGGTVRVAWKQYQAAPGSTEALPVIDKVQYMQRFGLALEPLSPPARLDFPALTGSFAALPSGDFVWYYALLGLDSFEYKAGVYARQYPAASY